MTLESAPRANSNGCLLGPDRTGHSVENRQCKFGSALPFPSPLGFPLVTVGLNELVDQETMYAINLDAVESRCNCALRSLTILFDIIFDLLVRQRTGGRIGRRALRKADIRR